MSNPYTCPVCAELMPDPVEEGNICPCCKTEFGYDDDRVTHEELRRTFVARLTRERDEAHVALETASAPCCGRSSGSTTTLGRFTARRNSPSTTSLTARVGQTGSQMAR